MTTMSEHLYGPTTETLEGIGGTASWVTRGSDGTALAYRRTPATVHALQPPVPHRVACGAQDVTGPQVTAYGSEVTCPACRATWTPATRAALDHTLSHY